MMWRLLFESIYQFCNKYQKCIQLYLKYLIIKCFCTGVLVCSSPGRHCCSIIIWGMWSRKAAACASAGGGVRRQAWASAAAVRRHAAGASLQAEKHKAESRTRGNNEVNKLSHWFCIPSMTYDTLYWIHGTNAYCVSQYSPRWISTIPTVFCFDLGFFPIHWLVFWTSLFFNGNLALWTSFQE